MRCKMVVVCERFEKGLQKKILSKSMILLTYEMSFLYYLELGAISTVFEPSSLNG